MRRATPMVAPMARVSVVISTSLSSKDDTSNSSTRGQRCHTMVQSSSMPMVMKNRPSSTS
ncbi:hypothetical protein D3C72_1866360 [compost metagenome]